MSNECNNFPKDEILGNQPNKGHQPEKGPQADLLSFRPKIEFWGQSLTKDSQTKQVTYLQQAEEAEEAGDYEQAISCYLALKNDKKIKELYLKQAVKLEAKGQEFKDNPENFTEKNTAEINDRARAESAFGTAAMYHDLAGEKEQARLMNLTQAKAFETKEKYGEAGIYYDLAGFSKKAKAMYLAQAVQSEEKGFYLLARNFYQKAEDEKNVSRMELMVEL